MRQRNALISLWEAADGNISGFHALLEPSYFPLRGQSVSPSFILCGNFMAAPTNGMQWKPNLHTFLRQVVKGYTASIWFSLSLVGYLPWKPAPGCGKDKTAMWRGPMQTATGSQLTASLNCHITQGEPSRACRLPASKFLQIMLSGADVRIWGCSSSNADSGANKMLGWAFVCFAAPYCLQES